MDQACSQEPWKEYDWHREIYSFGAGALVATRHRYAWSPVVGFIIFRMIDDELMLRRIVVTRLFQRTGIASALIARFEQTASDTSHAKQKIGEPPLKRTTCTAPEYATELHCTLRSAGYRCTEIIKTLNDSPGFYFFEKPIVASE
jgi:GNAT superfamily N-acetyltransferase